MTKSEYVSGVCFCCGRKRRIAVCIDKRDYCEFCAHDGERLHVGRRCPNRDGEPVMKKLKAPSVAVRKPVNGVKR